MLAFVASTCAIHIYHGCLYFHNTAIQFEKEQTMSCEEEGAPYCILMLVLDAGPQ